MRVEEILAMSTYELNEHYCAADVDLGFSTEMRHDNMSTGAERRELQYIRDHIGELCTKAAYAIRSNHFIAFREVLLRGVIKQAVLHDVDRIIVSSIVSPSGHSTHNAARSLMELLVTVVDLLFSSRSSDGGNVGFVGVALGTDAPCPVVPSKDGVVPDPPTVLLVEAAISILNDVLLVILSLPASSSSDAITSQIKAVFADLGLFEVLLAIMEGICCYWVTLSPMVEDVCDRSNAGTNSSSIQRNAIAKVLQRLMEYSSVTIPPYASTDNKKSDAYFSKDYDDTTANSGDAANEERERPLLMRLICLSRVAATLFIICLRNCRVNKNKLCTASSPKTTLHRVVRLVYNSMLVWDGTFMLISSSHVENTDSVFPIRSVNGVMSGDIFFQLQLFEILVRCRTHKKDVFSDALSLLTDESANDTFDNSTDKSCCRLLSTAGISGPLPTKFISVLIAALGAQQKNLPNDETLFIRLRGLLEELQISLNQYFLSTSSFLAAPAVLEVLRVDCSLTFRFHVSNSEMHEIKDEVVDSRKRVILCDDRDMSYNKKVSEVDRLIHATVVPTPTTIFFSPLFFILLFDKNASDESNFVTMLHSSIRSLRVSRDKSFSFRFIKGISVGNTSVNDAVPQRLFKRMIFAVASQLWREEMSEEYKDEERCFLHTGGSPKSPLLRFYEQMIKFGLNLKPFQRLFSVEDDDESGTKDISTKWTTPSPTQLLKWFMVITNDFTNMLVEETTLQLSSTSATISALTTSNIPSWIQRSKIASAPVYITTNLPNNRPQKSIVKAPLDVPIVSDERYSSLSLTVCDKSRYAAQKRSRSNAIEVHDVDSKDIDKQEICQRQDNNRGLYSDTCRGGSNRSRTNTDDTDSLVNDMEALLAKVMASSDDMKCSSEEDLSVQSNERSNCRRQRKEEAIMVHHKAIQCLVDNYQTESRKRREDYQRNIESAVVRFKKKNEDFKSYVRNCVDQLNKELEMVETVGNTLVQDIEDIRTEYGKTLVLMDKTEDECQQSDIVLSPLSQEEMLIHQQRTHISNPKNRVRIECKVIENTALEAIKNKVEQKMAELGEKYEHALHRFDPVRLMNALLN